MKTAFAAQTVAEAGEAQTYAWRAFHQHCKSCPGCEAVRQNMIAEPGITHAADHLHAHIRGCCPEGEGMLHEWKIARDVHWEIKAAARVVQALEG